MDKIVGLVLICIPLICLTEQEQPVYRGGARPDSGQAKDDNAACYRTDRFDVFLVGNLDSRPFPFS